MCNSNTLDHIMKFYYNLFKSACRIQIRYLTILVPLARPWVAYFHLLSPILVVTLPLPLVIQHYIRRNF